MFLQQTAALIISNKDRKTAARCNVKWQHGVSTPRDLAQIHSEHLYVLRRVRIHARRR